MRVLLLGASGLIGGAVAARLAAEGHEVTAVLRNPARAPSGLSKVVAGDLARAEDWLDHLDRAQALIHCACDWSADMAAIDAQLIDGILARRFAGRILYTGGVWIFGARHEPITEDSPHAAPAAFDWDVQGWRRLVAAGCDAVWVHPGLVWREGTPHYAPIEAAIRTRQPVPVLAPGAQIQPLVHAADLADGYLRALSRGQRGRDYLLVAENRPMSDIADAWAAQQGLPTVDLTGAADDPYSWSQRVESARALAELGWRPHYSDAVGTLRNSVAK